MKDYGLVTMELDVVESCKKKRKSKIWKICERWGEVELGVLDEAAVQRNARSRLHYTPRLQQEQAPEQQEGRVGGGNRGERSGRKMEQGSSIFMVFQD